MSVKYGGLEQQERRLRRTGPGDFPIVAEDTGLDGIECGLRLLAVTCHHVERHLRVKNLFGQRLKRKQIHRLLMQLVHAALPMLRGGFKNCSHCALDHACFLGPQQKQR